MIINFTVEEYFKQLQLMEQQYGQEEDLYPWIYMLLQMAECKKREQLGRSFQELSIRDVHLARKKDAEEGVSKYLREKNGCPDFVILDEKTEKFCGCVEIKKITDTLENISEMKEAYYSTLEAKVKKYEIWFKVNDNKIIKKDEGITCEINKDFEFPKIEGATKIEVMAKNKFNNQRILVEYPQNTNVDNDMFLIYCKANSYRFSTIESEYVCDTNLENKHKFEILSHLDKFGKVLFTNGLKFYLLERLDSKNEEKENKFSIKKIIDLNALYEEYKELENKFESQKGDWCINANEKWDEFVNSLAEIYWNDKPVYLTKFDVSKI